MTTPSPVFLKSIETNHNRHTGEYIAHEISSVINEVGNDKVIAVVTDNASNMKADWKIVKDNFPDVSTVGCAAHGLNLLLQDISKIGTFNLIITKSKEIIRYFKQKQALISFYVKAKT